MAKVIIRELLEIEVEVDSVDADDAIAQVESLYKNSRVILTSENHKQTDFVINNIIKKQIFV